MIAQPRHLIAALVFALFLASCGSAPPTVATRSTPADMRHDPSASAIGDQATVIALQQLGVPYRYGGASPSGFDCSGLVHFAYLQAGKPVPRTTQQLWLNSSKVERRDLQRGDLLFFAIEGKMQHVGLYIGGDRFVHAPQSGRKVSIASLNKDFYRHAFLRAGRPD